MVEIYLKNKFIATLTQDKRSYLIDYKDLELKNSICLSLPNTKKFYTYEYRFPPYFETFLPEGYLYEIFKNLLTKEYGYIDDYLIFSKLAPNIQSRIGFKSDFSKLDFDFLDIDTILQNDSNDTFKRLLETFLNKNAISGVQPKKEANHWYNVCTAALKATIEDIKNYMANNPDFQTIGNRMIDSFTVSLKNQTIKELPVELTRA